MHCLSATCTWVEEEVEKATQAHRSHLHGTRRGNQPPSTRKRFIPRTHLDLQPHAPLLAPLQPVFQLSTHNMHMAAALPVLRIRNSVHTCHPTNRRAHFGAQPLREDQAFTTRGRQQAPAERGGSGARSQSPEDRQRHWSATTRTLLPDRCVAPLGRGSWLALAR